MNEFVYVVSLAMSQNELDQEINRSVSLSTVWSSDKQIETLQEMIKCVIGTVQILYFVSFNIISIIAVVISSIIFFKCHVHFIRKTIFPKFCIFLEYLITPLTTLP